MNEIISPEKIIADIEGALVPVTKTKVQPFSISAMFTLIFMQFFSFRMPTSMSKVLSQSNWTYHTAFSIGRAAETLGLDCTYETMGRLDAVIQIPGEEPRTILFAEWEARYKSVFGEGQELEKLWSGSTQNKGANALLITYCPFDEYGAFVREVTEFWQTRDKLRKHRPVLFLVTILYEKENRMDVFQTISGIEIHKDGVKIWGDFDENETVF
ncbi:MAG: hypothetical protein H6654_19645 [Ardenticatenaceae bacterium]|nr:hypothetical protein [Ardenticatenaceae bacterium]